MNCFEDEIKSLLSEHLTIEEVAIEVPPDSRLGDYAVPCFALSKKLNNGPQQIAEELAGTVKPSEQFAKIEAKGPYLNFFVNKPRFAEVMLSTKTSVDMGKEKVMVEYSSPNANKPLHLGHIRNIVTGKAISNILTFCGNDVVQSCLVNDRGVHITKTMLAYQRWGGQEPDKKTDHFIGDYYVLFNDKVKNAPELDQEAQDILRKWEAGDKDTRALWKKITKWANVGFNETYERLGISFDKYYYESEMYDKGREIVLRGKEDGIFQEKDGAIYVPLESYGMPDKVLIRSDGTTIYMTQDIFLGMKKFEDYSLNKSVYVVGSEQNLHFKQLFKILELLKVKNAQNCYHLSYGMVYLPEGKMKSREGNVVDADDMIEDMEKLALSEINQRHSELDDDEKKRRAHIIGMGALKFFMLRTDPIKDMTFNPEESISFEGETGPYVQYAYARISSILRKEKPEGDINYNDFSKKEHELVRQVADFPNVVKEAYAKYKPSLICRYLLDLAQDFNEFYHKVPVLKSEQKVAKLHLLGKIRETLKLGLGLLDIEVLEEM